jgi:hypothetical protein
VRLTCQGCGDRTKETTPWNINFTVSVNDPQTGMQQGLKWSELMNVCEVCVEEHPNGDEPYRGRFWRPHLMKVLNRDRKACGIPEVVPS